MARATGLSIVIRYTVTEAPSTGTTTSRGGGCPPGRYGVSQSRRSLLTVGMATYVISTLKTHATTALLSRTGSAVRWG